MKWDTSRWSTERIIEFCIAAACLGCAIAFNSFMGSLAYVAVESAHPSPDMLLALLPRVDLRILFVWGFAAFCAWAIAMAWLRETRRIAHIAWLYALLLIVRGLFIALLRCARPPAPYGREATRSSTSWGVI